MKSYITILVLLFSLGLNAQQKVSELDLNKAVQSHSVTQRGLSVTGEKAIVAGVQCKDAIGVQSLNVITINTKGHSFTVKGAVGLADSQIDYSAGNIITTPQPDGTRVFERTVDGKKLFSGVESRSGQGIVRGVAQFKILGDGKELFSKMTRHGESLIPFNVDIKGVKSLELRFEDGGDGVSGDFGIWEGVTIDYDVHQASSISIEAAKGEAMPENIWNSLSLKLAKLTKISLPLPRPKFDWLVNSDGAKAQIYAGADGKSIVMSNGLTARIFRITPNLATIDIVNQMTSENMLRAVGSEGELVLDGQKWNLGGLQGQPERGYITADWVEQLNSMPNSFIVEDFEVTNQISTLDWARSRWALNKEMPTGKSLVFTLRGRKSTKDIVVKLRYDIYDGIPVIRKSMEVFNEGAEKVTLNSFKLEKLHFAEPESTEGDMSKRYMPNIHIESTYTCGGTFWEYATDRTEHWVTDKEYTSQCNYMLETLCTLEVAMEIGPDADICRDEPFKSYEVYEMPIDSYDRERKGLFLRRFYTKLTPWVTENPIFMHLTSIDPATVRTAVDQCAETGYEMIILSFGSGMNAESEDPKHIEHIKSLVDYAKSKGIEMGGYSLLASRWVSDEVDVINPKTGKRGGATFGSAPCLGSQWGQNYLQKVKSFYEKTGLRLFEHDGSYPGDVCASTTHSHHKGLSDSQWKQFKYVTNLYHWCLANGISLNVPDFYFMNGSTKVGIGYREVNWSLPRDRQIIHGRQLNFVGTFDRPASACWSFVPLVQYHGGGAEATLEPLSEHLKEYRQHMVQNYGSGVQACYRGPRLYDTEQTKECVKEVIAWYKQYRKILNSDMIHMRKADGRDWDGFLHVNPKLKEKGLAMLFNPLKEEIVREITLPLYYTGLQNEAMIRQAEGKAVKYKLNRDYTVTMKVTIPAEGYVWFVVE